MQHALPVTRAGDFSAWYQAVVREADLAEEARRARLHDHQAVGLWRVGADAGAAGPPLQARPATRTATSRCSSRSSYIAKEAEHVEGFAKEMAVVTHHRLKMIDGGLQPDPEPSWRSR